MRIIVVVTVTSEARHRAQSFAGPVVLSDTLVDWTCDEGLEIDVEVLDEAFADHAHLVVVQSPTALGSTPIGVCAPER